MRITIIFGGGGEREIPPYKALKVPVMCLYSHDCTVQRSVVSNSLRILFGCVTCEVSEVSFETSSLPWRSTFSTV